MKILALVLFVFFFAFAFCPQGVASPHVARNTQTPTRTRPGTQAQEDKSDGTQLLDACRLTINEMDDLDSAQTAFDAYRSGQCIGLIDGVAYASSTVCPGSGIRNSQLYRVVYKYLQDHPEELHLRDALLVRKALSEAFPCNQSSSVGGGTSSNDLWNKFETLRQGPHALHQEFEVTRHLKTAYREHATHFQINVDVAQGRWREEAIGGGGELTRIYDGHDLLTFESAGVEYTRAGQKGDVDELLPKPYGTKVDWSKSKELLPVPCGFAGKGHTCVIVEAPIKPWTRPGLPGETTRMTNGTARVIIDAETGIWLQCRTLEMMEGSRSSYQVDLTYQVKQMSYGASANSALFKLPDGLNEVKELTPWDEARINKQLAGRSAPELQVTDIQGKTISLADLKGKTVLLDFWTTWCPPCQADAPSIDKLNQKYGNKNLAIVAISVDEDREIVEKYLKKHPQSYPVVLSSENPMPRPYQIGAFPTYLIIGPDGTLMTAEEGNKGFGKLRKDLQKAGLEVE